MLLDRPLGQPENLLIAFSWSPLVGFLEEEEIAPLVALAVQHHRNTAATLIEGDDIHPLQLFQYLIWFWWLFFTEAEDMSARSRPLVLGAEYNLSESANGTGSGH